MLDFMDFRHCLGLDRFSFWCQTNSLDTFFGQSQEVSRTYMGSVFFLESRIYTKRELHHVRVGNLAGGLGARRHRVGISRTSLYFFLRRRARRHLMELLCIV